MQGDVIGLIALNFVLRVVFADVMSITFEIKIFGVHLHNCTANPAGLRVPRDAITDLESLFHRSTGLLVAIDLDQKGSTRFKKGPATVRRRRSLPFMPGPKTPARRRIGPATALSGIRPAQGQIMEYFQASRPRFSGQLLAAQRP